MQTAPQIVFLTRAPILHERGGSTTCALNLLALLAARGAQVTVVSTTGQSRSPRLFFKRIVDPPAGVRFEVPGYLRLGRWYLAPWNMKAWSRALVRAAVRRAMLKPLAAAAKWLWGEALFSEAWDLTPPTRAEQVVALGAVERFQADTLVANYAHWGPLLALFRGTDPSFSQLQRTAILMHDLLSARVERFRAAGLALDCPPITSAEEFGWLSAAGAVLAIQAVEAEAIRPHVRAHVLVQPMVLPHVEHPEDRIVPGRCLFLGSNIAPNQDALRFLLDEIWPRVLVAMPNATLAVVGRIAEALPATIDPSVLAVGAVESLDGAYAEAAVVLVPLRLGTGLKIKLLEAMQHGRAVVTTSVGAQGLEAYEDALEIADDPIRFAEATAHLLGSPPARRANASEGWSLIERLYGPQQALSAEFRRAIFGDDIP